MTLQFLTSREFNQDASRAKRRALMGPVIITDRGRPSHVLLSIEAYEQLTQPSESLIDLLSCDDAADVDFEPPRLRSLTRTADLD